MAGLIPPEFIAELNRRLDIVELVSRYVSLKKQGQNFVGLCPFHTEDTPSFIVSPAKQIYHCFGCHAGGNGINFLMQIDNLTFPEAVEKLAASYGMEMPQQELTKEEQDKIKNRKSYYTIYEQAADFYQQNLWAKSGQDARTYLESRGLTGEIAKKFVLGYIGDSWDELLNFLLAKGHSYQQLEQAGLISRKDMSGSNPKFFDRFRNRLMFPIYDYKGQVIAFGGRIMGDGQPKYLNSPETHLFHKSQNLYGLSIAGGEIRRTDQIVVMEGYMDVIAAHQFGVSNVVATLGTALTKEHAELIRRYTSNVILAYDGDAAGINAANKGMDILKEHGLKVSIIEFPDDLDPDDFLRKHGKVGWDDLISSKMLDFWDYKLSSALKSHDISNISGKAALVNQLLPDIQKCNNQVEKESFINLLAKTLGIGVEAIYSDLRKFGSARTANSQSPLQAEISKKQVSLQKLDKKQANLVLFMLYSQEIFDKVEDFLGLSFTDNKLLQELIGLIQKIKPEYSWQPSLLFSYLSDDATKDLLLKMMEVPIDGSKMPNLAWGCMRGIKIDTLRQQIADKKQELQSLTKLEDSKIILAEIVNLEQQIRDLHID